MWLQENLLAVGVFGLCTALVQVRDRACRGATATRPIPPWQGHDPSPLSRAGGHWASPVPAAPTQWPW